MGPKDIYTPDASATKALTSTQGRDLIKFELLNPQLGHLESPGVKGFLQLQQSINLC